MLRFALLAHPAYNMKCRQSDVRELAQLSIFANQTGFIVDLDKGTPRKFVAKIFA